MINKAKEFIKNGMHSCILIKDNKIIQSVNGRGIKPLLNLYVNNRADLEESFLMDKVIGKAAAMIAIDASVNYVYGYVMSKNAAEELEKNNIKFEYEILIDNILNRDETDLCPIEKISLKHNNVKDMINKINNFFA